MIQQNYAKLRLRFTCTDNGLLCETISDSERILSNIREGESLEKLLPQADLMRFQALINKTVRDNFGIAKSITVKANGKVYPLFFHAGYADGVIYFDAVQVPADIHFLTEFIAEMTEKQRGIQCPALKTSTPSPIDQETQQILTNYALLNNELVDMQRELAIKHRELAKAYREIEELSLTDPLTGAGNRRFFMDKMLKEIDRYNRYGHPLSITLFDIDFFKKVNDNYGHSAGDKVLQEFATCCMASLRNSDSFFRIGGEEFVALLINADKNNAKLSAERIRSQIEKGEILYEKQQIKITLSSGVAELGKGENIENILNNADQALYDAKKNGRNRVVVYHK